MLNWKIFPVIIILPHTNTLKWHWIKHFLNTANILFNAYLLKSRFLIPEFSSIHKQTGYYNCTKDTFSYKIIIHFRHSFQNTQEYKFYHGQTRVDSYNGREVITSGHYRKSTNLTRQRAHPNSKHINCW